MDTSFKFFRQSEISFFIFLMDVEIVEVTQISVKRYHGCCKVKRNDTRKLIDYKRGERYLFLTNGHCWKKTKAKYLVKRPYLTRRRIRLLKLLKQMHIVVGLSKVIMSKKEILCYYQISVKEGLDIKTEKPHLEIYVNRTILRKCRHCGEFFIITKIFKNDEHVFHVCSKAVNDIEKFGKIEIIWLITQNIELTLICGKLCR